MSLAPATGSTGIWQLFKERASRQALYGESTYWDARAAARTGLARSLWPSNAFNALWNERQTALLARSLGSLRGRRVVDVGCGTGRITRWLAREGGAREVVGLDFSQGTVEAARLESKALVASGVARFERANVVAGFDELSLHDFDDAIVLGCFSVACPDASALSAAFRNVARIVRPGGRVLLLEPIHRSRLLRRVLDLGIEEWIALANHEGLALEGADRMGFVPVRIVMSVREAPLRWVGPVFRAGERFLDAVPSLAPLSDYKLLFFSRRP
jgi:SAM-dependent methyltransferase